MFRMIGIVGTQQKQRPPRQRRARGLDGRDGKPGKESERTSKPGVAGSSPAGRATSPTISEIAGSTGVASPGAGSAPPGVPAARTTFTVLLYDLERYAGEAWAPRYQRGDVRFFLTGYVRHPGDRFDSLAWTSSGRTYEETRSQVPSGGRYFDRSTNFPSPMVPLEGWEFDAEVPAPRVISRANGGAS